MDNGPENNRRYIHVLVVIDNFAKFGWTVPLKNKNNQIIIDSFENDVVISKGKPNLFDLVDWKDFVNEIFIGFLKKQY